MISVGKGPSPTRVTYAFVMPITAAFVPAYTTSPGWLGYSDEKLRRLCEQVIEHVLDARLAVNEAARVLRSDGVLLVSTPQAGGRARDPLHTHEFAAGELANLLGESFQDVTVLVAEPRSLLALYENRYARAAINLLGSKRANPFVVRRVPSRFTERWHQIYAMASRPY